MALSRAEVSSAAALFTRQPRLAATLVATMMAMGVANPMAQGQAIMRTAIPNFIAKSSFSEPCASGSSWACMRGLSPPCMLCGIVTQPLKTKAAHTRKVMNERLMTEGTKIAATWSAVRCTLALLACASCTSLHIWPSAVSHPTLVTCMRKPPATQVVPPMTVSPFALGTAVLSPVSRLSSTKALASEQTVPSTGTLAPGYTRSTSPISTSSAGTEASPLPSQTTACEGMLEGRSVIACSAVNLARASSSLPSSTAAIRMGPMVKKWLVAIEMSCDPGVSGVSRQKKIRPVE
mmetsp:Transcript_74047/g.209696  ORF Transcript_74047/g.209696 Transcript_74047/m.209696 type:complete len:292 (+) Transcript_74047:1283-2158(+)